MDVKVRTKIDGLQKSSNSGFGNIDTFETNLAGSKQFRCEIRLGYFTTVVSGAR